MIEKIISGGQTGVDRGALDAALALGFPCGGWCPDGRLAADGPLDLRYPLQELAGGGYRQRTRQNVLDSDATLIVYRRWIQPLSGTELTLQFCLQKRKPYVLIDAAHYSPAQAASLIQEFADHFTVRTLNVAGPQETQPSFFRDYSESCIRLLLSQIACPSSTAR